MFFKSSSDFERNIDFDEAKKVVCGFDSFIRLIRLILEFNSQVRFFGGYFPHTRMKGLTSVVINIRLQNMLKIRGYEVVPSS